MLDFHVGGPIVGYGCFCWFGGLVGSDSKAGGLICINEL